MIQKIYLISILLMIMMVEKISRSVMILLLMKKKREEEIEKEMMTMKMMMVKRKRTKEEQRIKRKANRLLSHSKEEHPFLRKIKEISNKTSRRNNSQGRNKENQ